MSDQFTFDYNNPIYDKQKGQWYWEGRRSDTGKKIRQYVKSDEGQGKTAQYGSRQYTQPAYQYPSQSGTGDISAHMQNLSLQQPAVDPYGTVASNYTTYQGDSQAQGSSAYASDFPPSNYQTTPRTIPASTGYNAPPTSSSEQTSSRPNTSDQRASNIRDRPSYANPGQSEPLGASYGSGGDHATQRFDDAKGKSVAKPYSGQTTSGQQTGYGGYDYSDYHGPSQYGQSPGAEYEDYSLDKPRRSKHKGKGKPNVIDRRGSDDPGSQYRGYSHGGERESQWPSGTPDITEQYQGIAQASGSGPSHVSFQGAANSVSAAGEYDDPALLAGIEAGAAYSYGGTGGRSRRTGRVYEEVSSEMPPPASHPGPSKSYSKDIIGTKGQYEPLDKRYRVEPSSRFDPGEVFKVMWPEPMGAPVGGGSVITELVALQDHRDNVWTGFRRFIIIANDEGHCTCVPILTYGNQGCRKPGVKPSKHGIVCEQTATPAPMANEPKLGFPPIRMQMTATNEHISVQSRVNYSKLVTVEHNVKVFFIGRVAYEDWPIVQSAVDDCWGAKTREKSHHSHHSSRRPKK